VVRSVAERYLVAAFAFIAAATWLSVGLINGFACLFLSVLAFQAVRLYQRRSDSRGRAATRDRPSRSRRASAEERIPSRRHRATDRPASSGHPYDADRDEYSWSAASEPAW
jgi:type III secretory pathway component EscV